MIVGLRHATVENPGHLVYARLPGFHLSETGRTKAQRLGEALRRAPLRGVTHEAPLMAAMLVGQGRSMANYHRINLPHLGGVRLRPGPPEVVDRPEQPEGPREIPGDLRCVEEREFRSSTLQGIGTREPSPSIPFHSSFSASRS